MDKSIRGILNPAGTELTAEQESVVMCFEEVDQGMQVLDDLAASLDAFVDELDE